MPNVQIMNCGNEGCGCSVGQGARGPQGCKGATGSTGPTGPLGPTGPSLGPGALVVAAGAVQANGASTTMNIASVAHPGTGVYDLTLVAPPSDSNVVVNVTLGNPGLPTVLSPPTVSVFGGVARVSITNDAGAALNNDFFFTVVYL